MDQFVIKLMKYFSKKYLFFLKFDYSLSSEGFNEISVNVKHDVNKTYKPKLYQSIFGI